MITTELNTNQVSFVNFKRRYSSLAEEINNAVLDVLGSGSYILGDKVEKFERAIADYLGCKYVLGVANGTDALILALKALNIKPGDEVIVPVNSFVATAGAVAALFAVPVFCDVKDDLNIDVDLIPSLITNKTKAIIPVHLTGRPAQMDKILEIAKEKNIAVIEDAAQAIGAKFQDKMIGNIGDISCFSLHPLKNLHSYGDAGLITTNDEQLYNQMKLLRNHGLLDRDTCVMWGLNSRIDPVQAVIAMVGLRYLDKWNDRRRDIAEIYRQSLPDTMQVPYESLDIKSVYHNFVILTPNRDRLMMALEKIGIETKIHYPVPLHLQPAARSLGYKQGDFKVAEKLAKSMLSLPIFPELEDGEIKRIINGINVEYQKC